MTKPPIDDYDESDDKQESGGAGAPLFAFARNTDPDTSHYAASDLSPLELNHFETVVIECLEAAGEQGMTTMEISVATFIKRDSLTPRMPRLVEAGLVFDSGMRRRSVAPSHPCPMCGNVMNGSKRPCIVWIHKKFHKEDPSDGSVDQIPVLTPS